MITWYRLRCLQSKIAISMTLLSPQSMIKNIHVKPCFLNQKHSMFVETFTLNFKREATVNYCTQSSWDNNYFWGLLKIYFQWNPFSFVSDFNFISIIRITSSMIFDIRSRCAHVDVDKNIIYNKFSWMKYFLPQKIFFLFLLGKSRGSTNRSNDIYTNKHKIVEWGE